ncbi:MAG TPA: hypothetical protein VMZ90_03185 [Vicinamibacterales bacterium]|nr:hypothetical protein [Vicinamibacterales bacterium]
MDRNGTSGWPGVVRHGGDLTDADVALELATSGERQFGGRSSALIQLEQAVKLSFQALMGDAPVQLDVIAVLEEVSSGRTTAWVRLQVSEGRQDWPGHRSPTALLTFAARSTVTILEWMNQSSQPRLRQLQRALAVLSSGTAQDSSDRSLAPTSGQLVKAISAWDHARAQLQNADRVRVITRHGCAELDPMKNLGDPASMLVEKRLLNPSTDMIFVVELPDYHATGEWKLKHGDTHVTATCASGTLLDGFYRRDLDIRPGDGLHCRVEFETAYGPDFEVVSELFRIVDVVEILPAGPPGMLLDKVPAGSDSSADPRPGHAVAGAPGTADARLQ